MNNHDEQAPKRNGAAGAERGGRTVEEWNRIDRGEVDDDPMGRTDSTVAGAGNEPPD
jgi:hypothetical protein